jgi:ribonuclease VapC
VIVDTSALLAILFAEAGFEIYARAISDSSSRISAANFVELSIVAESRAGDAAVRLVESFFRESGVSIEPVSEEQAHIASQAYSAYGKGRHPAGLNHGDTFAYALAKATGEPLLFKGEDFRRTDILSALP